VAAPAEAAQPTSSATVAAATSTARILAGPFILATIVISN
jgi:hypothetical protein